MLAATGIAIAVDRLTPQPAARFYGYFMNRGGERLNRALERHVPAGVTAVLDQPYADGVALDVYFPAQGDAALPTIVWVHGGGFMAGTRKHVGNYLRILAGHGYTTVAVGYTLSLEQRYPTPVLQVNAAMRFLQANATRLRIDPQRFYLAGDSAGAQIAAQLANAISVPSYAKAVGFSPSVGRAQLRGVVLHCGVFDQALRGESGLLAHFTGTAIRAYGGRSDGAHMPEFSVVRYVTADFPPAFISAGNGDGLLAHSRALAAALEKAGVKVDALFFPADYQPALPHEYQFNLDTRAGELALARTLAFLKKT